MSLGMMERLLPCDLKLMGSNLENNPFLEGQMP